MQRTSGPTSEGCARVLAASLAFLGAACGAGGEHDEGVARAVRVSVQAEPAVRSQVVTLRLRMAALASLPQGSDSVVPDPQEQTVKAPKWPYRFDLPDTLASEPAFWVEAAALDAAGRELTQVRLAAEWLDGARLEPELLLRERCLDWVCGDPFTSCGEAGPCENAVRAADGLPQTAWP